MHLLHSLVLLWLSYAVIASSIDFEAQAPLTLSAYELRPAVYDDLEDVLDTLTAAFKPGPVWQYIVSDDNKYENYTRVCNRKLLQQAWEKLDSSAMLNVIAVPVANDDQTGGRTERVVSFGLWTRAKPEEMAALPILSVMSGTHDECAKRRDVNQTRLNDLNDKMYAALEPYMGNVTEPHLHLFLLATHPDWDGHDFGKAQSLAGIEVALIEDATATLLSTPAGYPLYESVGFDNIANITVELLDGLGFFWSEYMRWDA